MDMNSLSHTKWECKYPIVFAPKFRGKAAYGELRQDIANILNMLCRRKEVEIIEVKICPVYFATQKCNKVQCKNVALLKLING